MQMNMFLSVFGASNFTFLYSYSICPLACSGLAFNEKQDSFKVSNQEKQVSCLKNDSKKHYLIRCHQVTKIFVF